MVPSSCGETTVVVASVCTTCCEGADDGVGVSICAPATRARVSRAVVEH